jgi:hypothetical protein
MRRTVDNGVRRRSSRARRVRHLPVISLGSPAPDVVHAIQLALAPAFLLTGIAGMLNVMAGRLGRIIDRGRRLKERPLDATGLDEAALVTELEGLERRRRLASTAITACTLAALLVCMVIATLFLEELLDLPLRWLEGVLFTGSTLALVVGLGFFLVEVHLATQTIRVHANDSNRP